MLPLFPAVTSVQFTPSSEISTPSVVFAGVSAFHPTSVVPTLGTMGERERDGSGYSVARKESYCTVPVPLAKRVNPPLVRGGPVTFPLKEISFGTVLAGFPLS